MGWEGGRKGERKHQIARQEVGPWFLGVAFINHFPFQGLGKMGLDYL